MYWKYFKYLVEHKKNVGIECLKKGLLIHAVTHDLSKFRLSEFIPYAKYFFGEFGANWSQEKFGGCEDEIAFHDKVKTDFEKAWLLHQHRNKHHWDYWVNSKNKPIEIPKKYVKQMLMDWKGMSRRFGGSARRYFDTHKDSMLLHKETMKYIRKHFYS